VQGLGSPGGTQNGERNTWIGVGLCKKVPNKLCDGVLLLVELALTDSEGSIVELMTVAASDGRYHSLSGPGGRRPLPVGLERTYGTGAVVAKADQ
jgi:hypothetical protein